MATLSQFKIPGVGVGIVQPKLSYRWNVLFYDADDQQIVPALSFQVARIEPIVQNRDRRRVGVSAQVVMWFDDDILNGVQDAIDLLFELPFTKKIRIDICFINGDETISSIHQLSGCSLNELEHTALDYASSDRKTTSVWFSRPSTYYAGAAPEIKPISDGVLDALSRTKIALSTNSIENSEVLRFKATFTFDKLKFINNVPTV
jgi:hypothetical protein